MKYVQAQIAKAKFHKIPQGAAFNLASDPTATPLIKDSVKTYRSSNGQSVLVAGGEDCILRPLMGNGTEVASP